jgi:hypothetical protein
MRAAATGLPARARGAPDRGDRSDRLFEACRRLEVELDFDRAANAARSVARTRHRGRRDATDGPSMVKPYQPPSAPGGLMNTTDHDSRVVSTHGQPSLQGYNAQMTVNDRQVVLAAEITTESPDFRTPRADGRRHQARTERGRARRP